MCMLCLLGNRVLNSLPSGSKAKILPSEHLCPVPKAEAKPRGRSGLVAEARLHGRPSVYKGRINWSRIKELPVDELRNFGERDAEPGAVFVI
ncbi:hypothetical protein AVEN_243192-1 [Araneus ventricosus]|uniref:Uncharacterized protein n=1 Tax=Araneus ventricosus TaxID=182803 RepID=A0A4Y2EY27_ARAVE|nr:hypothetical protein AVEN_243192-1 [Araneus ventricosus]